MASAPFLLPTEMVTAGYSDVYVFESSFAFPYPKETYSFEISGPSVMVAICFK